jgi:long-chain fatty acid transport protein
MASLVLAWVQPALANNATNLLGYSAAAQGMAGAASVSVLDTSLINTNPASLFLLPDSLDRDPQSSIKGGFGSFDVGVLVPLLHHTDVFNNDRDGENDPFIALQGGVALRFKALPDFTFALGIFSQSGLGTDFRRLNTAFGTRDDLTSYERFIKLQSGISYKVTEDLSVGVGPYLGYSDLMLHLFPRTSVPGFAGIEIGSECTKNFGLGEPGGDCPWTVVAGAKVGLTYRVTPEFTVGAVYTSAGNFGYHDGQAMLDFSFAGLGRVRYSDVSVSGITHPQNVQVGLAYRPTPRWLLALDLTWHDWSVFEDFTFKLRQPNKPGAPTVVNLKVIQDWRDQYVVAVGAAYQIIQDVLTVRGGYNYSNNPQKDKNFVPVIQVPWEHHITAGVGYTAGHLEFDAGFVYAFEKKITYTNQAQPFGPNAVDRPEGYSINLAVGYRF